MNRPKFLQAAAGGLVLGVAYAHVVFGGAERPASGPATQQAVLPAPAVVPPEQRAPDGYAIAQTLKLPAVWRWGTITVNAQGSLLYVPQYNKTSVIDAASGKLVANLSGSNSGACSVAVVPEVGRVFVSNSWLGTVAVFDAKTHAPLGVVDMGGKVYDSGPMIYDPASKRLIICKTEGRGIVSFPADIDLKNARPEEAVAIEGKPVALVADGQGMIYVALYGGEIAVVDSRSMKAVALWPIDAAGAFPGGLNGISMDRERSRLFVSCGAGVEVLSAIDGHELARLQLKSGGANETAFLDGKIYARSNGGLTVIGQTATGAFEVQETVDNPTFAGGAMAVNPETGTLYLSGRETPAALGEKPAAPASAIHVIKKSGPP